MTRRAAAVMATAVLASALSACGLRDPLAVNRPPVFNPPSARTVTVLPGNTLYSIARAAGVPLRDLVRINGLKPPYLLRRGQRLALPAQRVYVVRVSDSLSRIAARTGHRMNALIRLNGLAPPYRLRVGQSLRLPLATGAAPPRAAAPVVAAAPRAVPVPRPRPSSSASPAATPSPVSAPLAVARAVPAPAAKVPPRRRLFSPPKRAASTFLAPVAGRVIGRFGPREGGLHNDGINIAAPRGAPIKAAENGIVAYAGAGFGSFGNLLLIKHADGWMSAYGHAQTLLVKRGDQVRRGQVVATVGTSGGVTRPQVHFELRQGTEARNPERYLAGGGLS